MFGLMSSSKSHYRVSFFCLAIVCILIACSVYERPEFNRLPYAVPDHDDSISSPVFSTDDAAANELTGLSVIRQIISGNRAAGRFAGSGDPSSCAFINVLSVPTGSCFLFRAFFCRTRITAHSFIITYIQNLDGMKS